MSFIAANNQPLAFVNQHFFREFIESLNHKFTLPSPQSVKRLVMNSYANCKEHMMAILNAEGNGNFVDIFINNEYLTMRLINRKNFDYDRYMEIYK